MKPVFTGHSQQVVPKNKEPQQHSLDRGRAVSLSAGEHGVSAVAPWGGGSGQR